MFTSVACLLNSGTQLKGLEEDDAPRLTEVLQRLRDGAPANAHLHQLPAVLQTLKRFVCQLGAPHHVHLLQLRLLDQTEASIYSQLPEPSRTCDVGAKRNGQLPNRELCEHRMNPPIRDLIVVHRKRVQMCGGYT